MKGLSVTKMNAAEKINDHLTYNQMCYTYIDFRKDCSHGKTSWAMYSLFGQAWIRNCESIQQWYEESYTNVGY